MSCKHSSIMSEEHGSDIEGKITTNSGCSPGGGMDDKDSCFGATLASSLFKDAGAFRTGG